jgi:hypothetical protein
MQPARTNKRPTRYEDSFDDEEDMPKRGKCLSKSIIERMSNAVYKRMNGRQQRAKKDTQWLPTTRKTIPKASKTPRKIRNAKKSSAEKQPKAVQQTSVNLQPQALTKPEEVIAKPKLRRSIVLEAFAEFFFNKATALNKGTKAPCPYYGSHKLWRILVGF